MNTANNRYTGMRYVPLLKGDWSALVDYEPLTVVKGSDGNSYTSKTFVPKGTLLTNIAYWVCTGNYNMQVEQYRQETAEAKETADNAFDLSTLINKNKVDWINAIVYGFKNDGVTNNDTIMNTFITNDETKTLYFPDGVYKFQHEIAFPNECHIILGAHAVLKLDSTTTQEYFISVRKNGTQNDYSTNSFITGGTINADYKATHVIGVNKLKCNNFMNNVIINGVLNVGIRTNTEGVVDGESGYQNILIENLRDITESEQENTIGIYDNGFDNYFRNVEIINMQTGVYTVAGRFTDMKIWIRSRNLLENSVGIQCDGYDINFNNVTVDTYRVGFKADIDGYGANICNMFFIYNSRVYTEELQALYPMIIFKGTYPAKRFMVNNLQFHAGNHVSFSDVNMCGYSSFVNVRTAGNTTQITNAGSNAVSMERLLVSENVTITSDGFGQISIPNVDKAVSILPISPLRCFCVRVDGGVKLFTISDDATVSVLTNTSVTVRVVYKNNSYNIFEFN